MRLYSYVVKVDRGLAPNPFWDYCTLAVCTLNHMGINAENGDWLIGTTSKARGNRLLFAMKVSDKKDFNEYFNDPEFECKKPIIDGTWQQQVGDNMYYKDDHGNWKQYPTLNHLDQKTIDQDLQHPFVYIARRFYYFGANAKDIPKEYKILIRDRQGCKCNFPTEIIESFINWLLCNYNPGIHGAPYDLDQPNCRICDPIDGNPVDPQD